MSSTRKSSQNTFQRYNFMKGTDFEAFVFIKFSSKKLVRNNAEYWFNLANSLFHGKPMQFEDSLRLNPDRDAYQEDVILRYQNALSIMGFLATQHYSEAREIALEIGRKLWKELKGVRLKLPVIKKNTAGLFHSEENKKEAKAVSLPVIKAGF